jgi:glucokinase
MPIPERAESYVNDLVASVRNALRHFPPSAHLEGIGIASIGPLDLKKGGMAKPTNLPYDFVPLVGPLSDEFGAAAVLVNDAKAAAWGEKIYGAGKDHENMVFVTISTGIGGGAIVDGHLMIGKDGNASEVGHAVVDPQGKLTCGPGCGKRGHWESYCSGRNIPNFANLLAKEEVARRGRSDLKAIIDEGYKLPNAAQVFHFATKKDWFAREVVRKIGVFNAMGIANVTNLYDPSLITLGGGVALNNPAQILGYIKKLTPKYTMNRLPEIKITSLGDDAGLLGALSLALGSSRTAER